MGDEIFTFESFINFMNCLKYFKTPFLKFSLKFCNSIIIYWWFEKYVCPSLTTDKGKWLEEQRNDTYLYFVTSLFFNHHQKLTPSLLPTMHGAGAYLCQIFGIMWWCVIVLFKQEYKEQTAIHAAAEWKWITKCLV